VTTLGTGRRKYLFRQKQHKTSYNPIQNERQAAGKAETEIMARRPRYNATTLKCNDCKSTQQT